MIIQFSSVVVILVNKHVFILSVYVGVSVGVSTCVTFRDYSFTSENVAKVQWHG